MWVWHERLEDLVAQNGIGGKYARVLGILQREDLVKFAENALRELFVEDSAFVEVWCLQQFVFFHAGGWGYSVVWSVLLRFRHKLARVVCTQELTRLIVVQRRISEGNGGRLSGGTITDKAEH